MDHYRSNPQFNKLHIYCGDGKGKTTAALGLAVRMAGAGGKVGILQFLKNGSSSEFEVLRYISNISILQGVKVNGFVFTMTEIEKERLKKEQNAALESAFSKSLDLLILDEALGAFETNTLDISLFLKLIQTKPLPMEIVLTGRNAPQEIAEKADYIFEVVKIKHPFDMGIVARKGVEY